MPPRHSLAAAFVLAVLTITAATVVPTAAETHPEKPNSETTITVAASGTAEAEPDQALVRVAVTAIAADADSAREQVAENATEMRNALAEAGLADDQIRTVGFDVRPEYTRDDREPEQFRATHAFEITVHDVENVGNVIDTAVGAGANEIHGVEFTLSDETRAELRQNALANAMDTAQRDAATVADSAALEITGVHSIQTDSPDIRPHRAEVVTEDAAGAETAVEPGPVTVTATVTVVYDAAGR